ncbi:MAG: VWA domain-containing protein [Chloroflexota bacterium]|nr:MAG: VWA domain-containing protein [Chloroflexota bacterium]
MIALVRALEHIEIGRKLDFYHAARSLLVHDKEDIPLFEQAFDLFWRNHAGQQVEIAMAARARPESTKKPPVRPPSLHSPAPGPMTAEGDRHAEELPLFEASKTYSQSELLRRKDFSEMTPEELEATKLLMSRLLWRLGQRKTRRHRPGGKAALDMRRTWRQNLRYGGEIIEWALRRPKSRQRPLVVIADISGSMERYTRLLLHFIYSLNAGADRSVEAFVFSTRLTRITRQLQDRDVDRAMKEVSTTVQDWAGGTRMGDAIKHFNYDWARRVLGRGAVVLLISDGWDRGEPKLLAHEIARLQRSCHRLIWLNPLLGSPDYEPLTRGMLAALPYVDDFLPAHSLSSLEELARHLSRLDRRRPARKQYPTVSSILERNP